MSLPDCYGGGGKKAKNCGVNWVDGIACHVGGKNVSRVKWAMERKGQKKTRVPGNWESNGTVGGDERNMRSTLSCKYSGVVCE